MSASAAKQAVKAWRKEHPEEFARLSEKGSLSLQDAWAAFQVWQKEHLERCSKIVRENK